MVAAASEAGLCSSSFGRVRRDDQVIFCRCEGSREYQHRSAWTTRCIVDSDGCADIHNAERARESGWCTNPWTDFTGDAYDLDAVGASDFPLHRKLECRGDDEDRSVS